MVGLPGGLSFEYRADDLRLRAVRRGAFVAGASEEALAGSALRPQGRLVELLDGGDPAPWVYACASGSDRSRTSQAFPRSPGAENPYPLDVRLSGTWPTSDGGAHLDATLPRNLQRYESMWEELRAVALDGAEGYRRSVSFGPVHLLGNDPAVFAVLASWPPDTTFARGAPSLAREAPPFSDEQPPFMPGEPPCLDAVLSGAWVVVAVDGGFEARWFDPPAAMGWKTLDGRLCVVANAIEWSATVVVLRLASWNDALLERYAQALARK